MIDFTIEEWRQFSKTEQRIILMNRQHGMDEMQIRMQLTWPLEALSEVTWRGHRARLMKKVSNIRLARSLSPL